jgi:two-component system chemotaxis response regulator CheY
MASILAVDDSPAMRSLMLVVLEEAGHMVFVKENGKDALEWAKGHTVDLVITDLIMPEMDGMALVSSLRKIEGYKNKPILVISTETAEYKKQKAEVVGATGWIAKPVDKERLLAAVARTVG